MSNQAHALYSAGFQSPATPSADIPPASNTGGKQLYKSQVSLIDYLTIVIPDTLFKPLEAMENGHIDYDHDQFIDAVNKAFLSNINLKAQPNLRGGKNFYSHSWEITDKELNPVGFVAHGGNKDSMCISISGAGTKHIGSAGYLFIQRWLETQGGHITRIDIAHDCFNGEKTIDDALGWFKAGLFRSGKNGTLPQGKYIDDFGSGAGRTLYIGNRKSGKLMRVYEKGRQLGDKESLWTRFELELRSTDRIIPPNILRIHSEYLSGSYECLTWVEIEQSYVKTQAKTAKVTFEHLKKHCKIAYGRLFNVMSLFYDSPEQILELIIRDDGFPRRLSNELKLLAQD